ncbi:hypothetical protein PENTCL1PPCAC_23384, partial [Pristionchus entomophagus]
NEHCPFPFIDLQKNIPVVLEDTLIQNYCDTAPPGYVVRIDHIRDTTIEHNMRVIVLDEDKHQLKEIATFPVENIVLDDHAAIIEIRGKSSNQEIQVSCV